MNKTEALMLVRLVKGICPAQQIDTYTPDAWAEVLVNVRFEDAKPAVIALAQQRPFIALSDIVTEVKRVRGARIRSFLEVNQDVLGAGCDPDDVNGYLEQLRSQIRAIGDGEADRLALTDGAA